MQGALDDTICAIATPPGEGGIGVVRVSGIRALDIASRVVRLRSGKGLHNLRTHVMALADLCAHSLDRQGLLGSDGTSRSFIDEALVVVMRGPHQFQL